MWGIGGTNPVWKIGNILNNYLSISLKAVEPEHLHPKIISENEKESLFGKEDFSENMNPTVFYEYHTDNTYYYLFENPVKISPKEIHVFAFLLVVVSDDEQNPKKFIVPEKILLNQGNLIISEISDILNETHAKKFLQWLNHII